MSQRLYQFSYWARSPLSLAPLAGASDSSADDSDGDQDAPEAECVRQLFEQSADSGMTWNGWMFSGRYVPRRHGLWLSLKR